MYKSPFDSDNPSDYVNGPIYENKWDCYFGYGLVIMGLILFVWSLLS